MKSEEYKKKKPLARLFFLVAEVGFEPHDLRVMSPTSYQAALLRDIKFSPVGAGDRGRTGTILSYHGILSPGRLPVPPHRQALLGFLCFLSVSVSYYTIFICLCQPIYEKFPYFSFFKIIFIVNKIPYPPKMVCSWRVGCFFDVFSYLHLSC